MHFSFVSQLMIFGKSDHLTLPQRQQRQPKPGEYFITYILSQHYHPMPAQRPRQPLEVY